MSPLILLFCIVVLVWFWLSSLNCRDIAVRTARAACARQGLQFLDGTVSLKKIRPFLTEMEAPGLRRTYVFEYSSDGFSRQTGCIVLHNQRVSTVLFEADSP